MSKRSKTASALDFVDAIGAFALFSLFLALVIQLEFRALAAAGVPLLAVFYGMTSLLYNRARALPSGPQQRRSLLAAEHALRGTILFLLGCVGTATMAGMFLYFGFQVTSPPRFLNGLPLLFIIPYAPLQFGFQSFMRSVRIVAPRSMQISNRKLLRSYRSEA
jgi:hypothetical protein